MQEKEKTTLRIAIIADTWNAADYYYKRFVNDNRENVFIPGKNRTIMTDGTIIEKFCLTDKSKLRGVLFDQVLLCINKKITPEMLQELLFVLSVSQVPSPYWFLQYDEDDWD